MELLCQYTKVDSAIKIFEGMSLKLGRVADSNDPAEIKKLSITNNCDIDFRDKLNFLINEYLDNILKITCFTYGIHDFNYSSSLITDDDGRSPFYKPRMWSLYGGSNGNNAGVCIVFNKERIESKFSQLDKSYNKIFKKITYSDFLDLNTICEITQNTEGDITKGKELLVQNYLQNNAETTFCQKDMDWEAENEYRLLCWNKIDNTDFSDTFVFFEANDVEAVILGYNIFKSENYKQLIASLLSKRIPVYKMGLVENHPALKEIYDVNDDELETSILELFHEEMNKQRDMY